MSINWPWLADASPYDAEPPERFRLFEVASERQRAGERMGRRAGGTATVRWSMKSLDGNFIHGAPGVGGAGTIASPSGVLFAGTCSGRGLNQAVPTLQERDYFARQGGSVEVEHAAHLRK